MSQSSNVRQVIVMRKFKELRKGKYISQGCHASMAFMSDIIKTGRKVTEVEQYWMENSFTKICLYVETEEELDLIHKNALEQGLTSHLIIDNGLTEFHGVKTKTCVAIGPDYKEKIDKITGHLPLF